jgi:hypothetical protein
VAGNFVCFFVGGFGNLITMKNTVIFVYNADADYFSQVSDYLHKVFRPKSYSCNLCRLTHTNFGMKNEFRHFIKKIPNIEFLHKDEFLRKFSDYENSELPAVFFQHSSGENKLEVLLNRSEINKLNSLDDLIRLLRNRLKC